MSKATVRAGAEDESVSTLTFDSLREMTIKVKWVFAGIGGAALLCIGATVALYETGVLNPNLDLIEDLGTYRSENKSLLAIYEGANSRISQLEQENKKLSEENAELLGSLDLERIQSEERIRIKQLELETKSLVQIAETESRTRIAEAEIADAASERDSTTEQIQSFNNQRSQILLACMELKSSSASSDKLEYAEDFLNDCNFVYEYAVSKYEKELLNPEKNPEIAQTDQYAELRGRIIAACVMSKGESAPVDELENTEDFVAVDYLEILAGFVDECSSDFDMNMSEHEEELRALLNLGFSIL